MLVVKHRKAIPRNRNAGKTLLKETV